MSKVNVMHYTNQFFAGIGGEDKADVPAGSFEGAIGAGRRLQDLLGDSAEIVVTVYCGDDYFAVNADEATAFISETARNYHVRFLVAGPAFSSGRHGLACAEVCNTVSKFLGLQCVTGMHLQNPGIELYKRYKNRKVYAFPTAETALGMEDALKKMAQCISKLACGFRIGPPATGGYIPRGVRCDDVVSKSGAERAVDMLLNKLAGQPFITEIPVEIPERAPVAPRIIDLTKACLALVTSSGIIPHGNPDGFKAQRNEQWRKYSIEKLDTMKNGGWDVLHSGYNNVFMKANSNFGVPLDVCRELEREGVFAQVYPYFYTTSGCNASVYNMQRIGRGIVADMNAEGVDAALMVST